MQQAFILKKERWGDQGQGARGLIGVDGNEGEANDRAPVPVGIEFDSDGDGGLKYYIRLHLEGGGTAEG